ncbi:MAG: hypothetical protein CMJ31_14810 [Phycisphaerae bacterium]|nr:hypothetical protein [Phycisphaerae bacterium]
MDVVRTSVINLFDLDHNADDRFNQHDLNAVLSIATVSATPTSNPSLFPGWDLNGDQVFDLDDWDAWDALLNSAIDGPIVNHGVFGDFDGDGDVDCDDYNARPCPWTIGMNETVCNASSDYSVRLDYNLDGQLDGVDEAAFFDLFDDANLQDLDKVVDGADNIRFLQLYGAMDAAADLAAPYGTWDVADVVAWLQLFGASCLNTGN